MLNHCFIKGKNVTLIKLLALEQTEIMCYHRDSNRMKAYFLRDERIENVGREHVHVVVEKSEHIFIVNHGYLLWERR